VQLLPTLSTKSELGRGTPLIQNLFLFRDISIISLCFANLSKFSAAVLSLGAVSYKYLNTLYMKVTFVRTFVRVFYTNTCGSSAPRRNTVPSITVLLVMSSIYLLKESRTLASCISYISRKLITCKYGIMVAAVFANKSAVSSCEI
jgi:hypothetical protein